MTEQFLEVQPTPGPFFRFTDETSWLTAARTAGLMQTVTDDKGIDSEVLQAYTRDHAIDVIGIITEGGEWDKDGNETVPPIILPGWHVNYQGALPDGWEQFEVKPASPHRIWAP